MVVVCSVCRDVVHVSGIYILPHGARYHGNFVQCAGSNTPIVDISSCCC